MFVPVPALGISFSNLLQISLSRVSSSVLQGVRASSMWFPAFLLPKGHHCLCVFTFGSAILFRLSIITLAFSFLGLRSLSDWASMPLRFIVAEGMMICFCQSMAFVVSVLTWASCHLRVPCPRGSWATSLLQYCLFGTSVNSLRDHPILAVPILAHAFYHLLLGLNIVV
jgi:hypothetical protein